jgi:hypothetical protein
MARTAASFASDGPDRATLRRYELANNNFEKILQKVEAKQRLE